MSVSLFCVEATQTEAMQRRNFSVRRSDSILLYGFGLALALSLVFNGFLLYKQSRQRSMYQSELGNLAHAMNDMVWEQQLSDCKRANLQKDSLIHQLEQVQDPAAIKAVTVGRTASK